VLTYNQLLDEIGFALGRNAPVRKIHQPLSLMKPFVSLLQGLPAFPITRDQLTMLLEENICTGTSWQEGFSLSLSTFSAGIRAYL
jgi:NADH dehydrogenase